jgi:erythritol transport system substrate-binding protein
VFARAGFNDILNQYPDVDKVAAQSANWDQNEGFQKTQTLLQRFPKLKGLISGNDTMALGAYAALKAAGRNDIVVVGFDGNPDAVASINAGGIKATVLQPIVQLAESAVEQADHYVKTGKADKLEKQTYDCILVTGENSKSYNGFHLTSGSQ